MFVGAYWPGNHNVSRGFFNANTALKQGVFNKYGGIADANKIMSGGLDAEIHELRVWNKDITSQRLKTRATMV